MSILGANKVRSGYGELEILHGVSIEVSEGEIVAIIGPNGSGKSTLMKTIFGLLTPNEGKVTFRAEEITGLKPDRIVRRGMCYVPQEGNVFPSLSVEENLEMGAFTREDDYSDQISEIYQIFPILQERRKQRTGKLSGGQQQMVAIGRALMLEPDVLLLDEPTAGLAPKLAEMILHKVSEINESGVAILMVEQNAKEALSMSERGYVLAMGRNQFEDTGQALLNNAKVGRLYLGG